MIGASPQAKRILSGLTSSFQRDVFNAAVLSFEQKKNPLRVNNFATGLRELSRIMLQDLAPDSEVKGCGWFIQKTNTNGQPVIERAQRAKYAVQAGLTDQFVKTDLEIDVEKTVVRFVKLVNRLSEFTHVTERTFNASPTTADALAKEALSTFSALFRTITKCRAAIVQAVETHANEALIQGLINDTVQELDEIATHYYVRGSGVERLRLENIDSATITLSVSGFVDCQLQYGSDGDVERGDGARSNHSYPLACTLQADIQTPDELEITPGSLYVDNSSFYE